ncbi:MAG: CPBP family intramembrane metalloprotease [Propionibacteriaceae bacterium]|nr:CPBP family intramembrane metalloprotease [Propionibacteriaceae bacterium]
MQHKPVLKVRWKRVGLFYAIALGWSTLVGAVLAVLGISLSVENLGVVGLFAGALCMPAPMVAALIVERVYRERPLLKQTFVGFSPKVIGIAVGFVAGLIFLMYGLTWAMSGSPGIPGAGSILTESDSLASNLEALTGAAITQTVPPFLLLITLAGVGALVAGFTINGLFGYFEEYGWRGWLANELRPLGTTRLNVLTGVLWGLWHTPLIWLGFNFSPYNLVGPIFMVLICIPLSFVFWRARKLTGSLLTPGILHGAFNGFSGIFVITLAERNPLVAAPMGVIGAVAVAILAFVFWSFPTVES